MITLETARQRLKDISSENDNKLTRLDVVGENGVQVLNIVGLISQKKKLKKMISSLKTCLLHQNNMSCIYLAQL